MSGSTRTFRKEERVTLKLYFSLQNLVELYITINRVSHDYGPALDQYWVNLNMFNVFLCTTSNTRYGLNIIIYKKGYVNYDEC